MSKKLIICKGLPGSGKSTWAKAQEGAVVVNKDTIRLQLGKPWSFEVEKEVIKKRDALIYEAFKGPHALVISDDTNLAPKHEFKLRYIASECDATVEIESFLGVPVEECIRRDALREGVQRVGAKVIRDMAEQFNQGIDKYVPDPTLPNAIICDLDGTLCIHNGRSPYEYDKCDTDLANEAVLFTLLSIYSRHVEVIYLSGREDIAREKTAFWLAGHACPLGPLFMRAKGDFRKDSIVKRELFDAYVRGKYNVVLVLDDRDQVVKLWRDMGLTCFQVNYGNF